MKLKAIILTTLIAAALIPGSPQVTLAESSNAPNSCSVAYHDSMEDFADLYIDVYNSQDVSRFDEVMAPGAINYNPLGTVTVPELAGMMQGFYAAFPDLTYEVVQVLVDGDRLILEYTYTGTHLGELMGVPATGTVVHGRGLEVHVMEAGLIAETYNYSDVFGLFAQLGLI